MRFDEAQKMCDPAPDRSAFAQLPCKPPPARRRRLAERFLQQRKHLALARAVKIDHTIFAEGRV